MHFLYEEQRYFWKCNQWLYVLLVLILLSNVAIEGANGNIESKALDQTETSTALPEAATPADDTDAIIKDALENNENTED